MGLFKNKKEDKSLATETTTKIKIPTKIIRLISNVYYGHCDCSWECTGIDCAEEQYAELAEHIGQDYIFSMKFSDGSKQAFNLKFYAKVCIVDGEKEVTEDE